MEAKLTTHLDCPPAVQECICPLNFNQILFSVGVHLELPVENDGLRAVLCIFSFPHCSYSLRSTFQKFWVIHNHDFCTTRNVLSHFGCSRANSKRLVSGLMSPWECPNVHSQCCSLISQQGMLPVGRCNKTKLVLFAFLSSRVLSNTTLKLSTELCNSS